jgi:hypothetical protein
MPPHSGTEADQDKVIEEWVKLRNSSVPGLVGAVSLNKRKELGTEILFPAALAVT